MKALAARERDLPDLRLLADLAGIDSADAAIDCAEQFFPMRHCRPVLSAS
jgi:hypothetical protein